MKYLFLVALLSFFTACSSSGPKSSDKAEKDFIKSLDADSKKTGKAEPVKEVEEEPEVVEDSGSLRKKLANLIEKKDYSEARRICGQLLSQNSQDIVALSSLGIMAYQEGKYGIASLFWSRVLAKDPKNSSALNNLGVIAKMESRDSDAISLFKQAIQSDTDNTAALANLGTLYLSYQNYKAANASFSIAKSKYSKNSNFQANYALSLNGVGEGRSAIRILERLYEENPKDIDIAMNYISVLVHNKSNLKEASDLISRVKILTQDPDKLYRLSLLQKAYQQAQASESVRPKEGK